MSATPRTDAMTASMGIRCPCAEKPIELCLQLEIELAAVISDREKIREWAGRCQSEMEHQSRLAMDAREKLAAAKETRERYRLKTLAQDAEILKLTTSPA